MIGYVSQGYFNHCFLLSHSSVSQFVSVPVFIRGPIFFFSTSPDFKLQASELVWHTYLCVNFTYLYPFAVFQRDIDFI